jgi:hypothetical protein
MNLETTTVVDLRKHDSLEKAQAAAASEVANTGAVSMPVIVFKQGKRLLATGAMPMSWVSTRLESRSARSAKKGGSMLAGR